jgi:hypothetical protein
MKKLLFLLLLPLLSFGQLIIDQSIVEPGPYKVGDIITLQYTVNPGNLDVNYIWFRYDYKNKNLEMVPNSTIFIQGTSTQTFYTHWNNFRFNPNPQIGVGELLRQYNSGGWNYTQNNDWNVGQLSVQRTDASISGVIATQKYQIKDNTDFQQIHKLHLAYATTRNNVPVSNIGSTALWLNLNNVSRLVSSVKFKVAFPSGYDITKHNVQVMTTNAQGVVDWTTNPQPAVIGPLDSSGEFITDKLEKNKQYLVLINPAFGQNVPDNIITVTDAYKAFKAINNRGLNNTDPFFGTKLESAIANVTQDQSFDSQDAYYLFASIMGIDLSSVTGLMLPTKDQTKPIKFMSGFTSNFSELNSPPTFTPVEDTETYNLSYAWAGDLDFSHSSPLVVAGATSSSARSFTSANTVTPVTSTSTTTISTSLVNSKVVVTVGLSTPEAIGAEYKIGYDDSKLTLEDIAFDTGNTLTNFSTVKGNVITFGSINQTGNVTIKPGTPYRLIFSPKTPLTNTSGLIFTYFAEAVDQKANKIILKIQ